MTGRYGLSRPLALALACCVAVPAFAADEPWAEKAIAGHVDQKTLAGRLDRDTLDALRDRGEALFTAKFTELDGAGRSMATSWERSAMARMPSTMRTSSGETPRFLETKSFSSSGIEDSTSRRITDPRRRCLSAVSKKRTRSSASSSTSMSLSRTTRKAPRPVTL